MSPQRARAERSATQATASTSSPAGAEQALHLVARRGVRQRAVQDPGEIGGEVVDALPRHASPGGVVPLRRQAPRRHRRVHVLPGRPRVAGPRGAGAVDLVEPGLEERAGERLAGVVDRGPREGRCARPAHRGASASRSRATASWPQSSRSGHRAGSDRVERLVERGDHHRYARSRSRGASRARRPLEALRRRCAGRGRRCARARRGRRRARPVWRTVTRQAATPRPSRSMAAAGSTIQASGGPVGASRSRPGAFPPRGPPRPSHR